jgi:hypothetical protein
MKVMFEMLALLPAIFEGPDAHIGLKYSYNKYIRGFTQLLKTNS